MNTVEFDSLKRVLFGKQKQANAINDAVVTIVGDILKERAGCSWQCEDDVVTLIVNELNDAIANADTADRLFVQLVAGVDSYTNLTLDDVLMLVAEQPNPESPKYIFRIKVFGDVDVAENAAEMEDADNSVHTTSVQHSSGIQETPDSCVARVNKVKRELLAVVPSGLERYLPDESDRCLYVAETYYRSAGKCL